MGHAAGDELLITVAERMAKPFAGRYRCAAWWGRVCGAFEAVPDSLRQRLSGSRSAKASPNLRHRRPPYVISASIGIAMFRRWPRCTDLLGSADEAMYLAKAGTQRCRIRSGPITRFSARPG